jgi:hypothetical protein
MCEDPSGQVGHSLIELVVKLVEIWTFVGDIANECRKSRADHFNGTG